MKLATINPKRTRKLLVYLDQNFLSEMAKVDLKERIRPEFSQIFDLLHRGFIDEKLAVPRSWLHDVESSLATHLKKRIASHQSRLGQIRLFRPDEIRNHQVHAAFVRFCGRDSTDPLDPQVAFLDDPDRRVDRFEIRVDGMLEADKLRNSRRRTAESLEGLRQTLVRRKASYESQLNEEQESQREEISIFYRRFIPIASEETLKKIQAFVESKEFLNIPLLNIEARLFASLLARNHTRPIKSSDATDVDVLSAYVPYMDIVCTDAFMAEQLRSLRIDQEYGTAIFHAKTSSLRTLKTTLEEYLSNVPPVRKPSITVFVLPIKGDRTKSCSFFFKLGSALRAMGTREYGEVYAFDDGAMPEFTVKDGPRLPFYGLQEVTTIAVCSELSSDALLNICNSRCRSDHFVLIDCYEDVPETFMLSAAMSAEAGIATIHGFRIFKKPHAESRGS